MMFGQDRVGLPPLPPPKFVPPLSNHAKLSEEVVTELAAQMFTARAVEERVIALYREGIVRGGLYSGMGNEATSVATAMAIDPAKSFLVPTHRDLGSHLVFGHEPSELALQYLGRGAAQTEGKDSGLHLGRAGSRIVGMISHLAHMMPVAVGVALAERQRNNKEAVVLTSVGDGATSLGDFHESLNFAGVHKLPVIFLIVNNQYAYSTPTTLQYACEKLSSRAAGYGMHGVTIDGTDPFVVYETTRLAAERARQGEGPTLIESITMRMRGHSEHDDHKYVPAELLEAWRGWDPITRISNYLLKQQGQWTADSLQSFRRSIEDKVHAAFEKARKAPEPLGERANKDVYAHWESHWTLDGSRGEGGLGEGAWSDVI